MRVKLLAFVLAGAALTGALWLRFDPQHNSAKNESSAIAAVSAGETPPAGRQQQRSESSAGQKVFEIEVKEGKLISSATLQAHEGDEITLRIVSDRDDEVHLHGYDLRAHIAPGEPVKLAFVATRTGRFGLETHHSHLELATLEVYPR
jgi:uncharacterized cupredoxin-like copper-binding protein